MSLACNELNQLLLTGSCTLGTCGEFNAVYSGWLIYSLHINTFSNAHKKNIIDFNLTEIYIQDSNCQQLSIGSGNGLLQNRRQAIT